jgi:hypothetical protein
MNGKIHFWSRFQLKTFVFLCISKNSRLKGLVPEHKYNNSFEVFGGNVFKCNGLSKLLGILLGPLVYIIMQ